MLNAFRHLRSNHLASALASASTRCAQRLSASQIESLRRCGFCTCLIRPCSTPFGISDRITNAEQNEANKIVEVLNAFRHLRSNHGSPQNQPDRVPMCSTPFGISDRITANWKGLVFVEKFHAHLKHLDTSEPISAHQATTRYYYPRIPCYFRVKNLCAHKNVISFFH